MVDMRSFYHYDLDESTMQTHVQRLALKTLKHVSLNVLLEKYSSKSEFLIALPSRESAAWEIGRFYATKSRGRMSALKVLACFA